MATERLSVLPDSRVSYRLRYKWRNGATHVIFDPLFLVAKLAALVPPPRFNLARYHAVLSANACWRDPIVPSEHNGSDPVPCPGCSTEKGEGKKPEIKNSRESTCSHPRNYSRAELLKRVFEIDVLECPNCGGWMRVLSAINTPSLRLKVSAGRPEAIRKILDCLGLPSRPPSVFAFGYARQADFPRGRGAFYCFLNHISCRQRDGEWICVQIPEFPSNASSNCSKIPAGNSMLTT